MTDVDNSSGLRRARLPAAFGSGTLIGTLGGLIGLGGAEFRLPLLISLFRFSGLEAVILNKATSLVVVATALPFRASTVPFSDIGSHWLIIVNLLGGSLAGAWVGAGWATRLKSETLFYDCKGCGERLKPLEGDCCVFCSYGSVRCPPLQAGNCG
jgi:uncharacterized membrane protein YfcA